MNTIKEAVQEQYGQAAVLARRSLGVSTFEGRLQTEGGRPTTESLDRLRPSGLTRD
jgi:hypothetical protein